MAADGVAHGVLLSMFRSKTVEHPHLMRLKHRNPGQQDVDVNFRVFAFGATFSS